MAHTGARHQQHQHQQQHQQQQRLLQPLLPRPAAERGGSRRVRLQRLLSSRAHHAVVLGLIAVDVAAIFADIFIDLAACDSPAAAPPLRVAARRVLGILSLVLSCLFMAELILDVWAFRLRYFDSWFHRFDATVVLASFLVDVVLRGLVEDIASLVVALRLWRFVRILDEVSLGADEQMSELHDRIRDLEAQNARLSRRLTRLGVEVEDDDGHEGSVGSGSAAD